MMRARFVLLLATAVPAKSFAAGYYVPDVGVHALGRAGAFVARADDQTAAWYNPAGFADQGGTRALFDLALTKQSNFFQRADDSSFGPVGNSAAPKIIPFLGVSSDFGLKNFTFAVSGFGPYAKNTEFPADGPQRYSLIHSTASEAFYQLSVGWRPVPWLKLGAAFRGEYFHVSQGLAVSILANNTSDARVDYDVTDRFAANASFGMILSPTPFFDFGVSYRPAPHFLANGTLTVNADDLNRLRAAQPGLSNLALQGSNINIGIETASILRAGVRYHEPRFDIEADFVWESWAGFGRVEIRPVDITYTLLDATPHPLPAITQDRNYGNGYSFRLGGDIQILPGRLTGRVGYFFETSAVPDASVSAALIDANKHGFGVGLSARFRWFELSVAYAHVQLAERNITESNSRQINLTYLALGAQNSAPVVGNGLYRAGWDNLVFGIAFDIDTAAGWTRRQ
jgi:long-chain fatty acid transport protein